VSYSAILFYGYVGVIGLAVWSALRYFKSTVSLSQIWCTYGALASAAAVAMHTWHLLSTCRQYSRACSGMAVRKYQ